MWGSSLSVLFPHGTDLQGRVEISPTSDEGPDEIKTIKLNLSSGTIYFTVLLYLQRGLF